MATIDAAPAQRSKSLRQQSQAGAGNGKWAIGFAVAAAVIFVFNQYILPNTSQATQDFFRAWLPMTSVNEAMIWVIARSD